MKKSTIESFIYALIVTTLCVACNGNESNGMDGIPFRTSEDGKWGMMGTDGKVLFDSEFKNAPTISYNGRFMVKNDKNTWDIYSTDKTPKEIAGGFIEIADFTENVTPAVKEGQNITLIDKDGKTVATLDKADGKKIIAVSNFSEGLAQYKINGANAGEELYGMINTKGDVVIKAEYCKMQPCSDGKILAVKEKYRKEFDADKTDNIKVTVLSSSGDELFEIPVSKYEPFEGYEEGYLAVRVKDGDTYKYGYLDSKGETALKPTDKIEGLGDMVNKKFVYMKDDQYGVMNIDGETIIRAKYDNIIWATEDLLWVAENNDDNVKWHLINLKGENVGTDTYSDVHQSFDGKVMAVKVSDKTWDFVDTEGKEVKDKEMAEFFEMSLFGANKWVESDKLDWDAVIQAANLTKEGLGGFELTMTPQQLIEIAKKMNPKEYSAEITPDNYQVSQLSYEKDFNGITMEASVNYIGSMTVYNYDEWGFSQASTWTTEQPDGIDLKFTGEKIGRLKDSLFKKLVEKAKSFGKVYQEREDAVIISIASNKSLLITKGGNDVFVTRRNIGPQYWNINEFLDNESYDVVADTVAADSDFVEPY